MNRHRTVTTDPKSPEAVAYSRVPISLREMCRRYHVGHSEAVEAVRSGELRASRPGKQWFRIDPRDIEAWLLRREVRAPLPPRIQDVHELARPPKRPKRRR